MCKEKGYAISKNNYEKVINDITTWQKENRDATLGYMRKFYQNNKEDRRLYVKSWVRNNPERAKELAQAHRKHDITVTEWESCKRYFNFKCAYCGLPIDKHFVLRKGKLIQMDFHKEHVDDNGANDLRNCAPSCQTCNSTKHLKTMDELFESGLIENFTKDKYNIIIRWIIEDYKQYIEEKLPYKIIRKRNDGQRTYHYELWTVDDLRNTIECKATANKKQELDIHIKKYFE